MLRVGVFVEQEAEEIQRIMKIARLDLAQLHGGQSLDCALAVGPERVIRVIWPDRYAHRLFCTLSCKSTPRHVPPICWMRAQPEAAAADGWSGGICQGCVRRDPGCWPAA